MSTSQWLMVGQADMRGRQMKYINKKKAKEKKKTWEKKELTYEAIWDLTAPAFIY